MFKKTQLDSPSYTPKYECPTCRTRYFGIHTMLECQTQHRMEEKKMIENQVHAQKIELLDRALEYSKYNQVSLAEAQKEINDFLTPPTCQWTLLLDHEEYPCSLPKDHDGQHESGKMLKFNLKLEER